MPLGGLGQGGLLGDRYRLERRLGAGGMASVWLARDERLGRPVAVKVVSDALAGDESYLARFRREARVAAGLSHPNLVNVYDFGGRDERPYLVMELVEGPTLADRIADGSAPQLDHERLATELLGALRHIHAAGVVHRDVKPSNVLLGPDGRARLTDFGIAQPADATQLTQTGQVIGSLRYMAPEVARGEPATERSDLYSLGVVLGESAGKRPPAPVAELTRRLTVAEPELRPASASDALALLGGQAAARAVPAQAQTPTAPTAPLPPTAAGEPAEAAAGAGPAAGAGREIHIDRRKGLLAAAGLVGLAGLILVLALVLGGGNGEQAGTPAPKESPSARNPPTEPQEPAAPAPAPEEQEPEEAEPPPEPAADPCAGLEQQEEDLKEEEKAAEEEVKEDKEAREQVKESFDAREEQLKAQIEQCKEQQKEGEGEGNDGGSHGPPPHAEAKGQD